MRTGTIAVAMALAVLATGLHLASNSDAARDPAAASVAPTSSVAPSSPAGGANSGPGDRQAAAPAADPEALQALRSFRTRIRRLAEAPAPRDDPASRQLRARLEEDIERFTRSGYLIGPQATWLRIAVLRAEAASEEEFQARARALLEESEARSSARRQASEAALAASNAEYRRRELAIVKEVMASTRFVDESARQQALRERLRVLRGELRDGAR